MLIREKDRQNDFVNFKEALQNSNITIKVHVLEWQRVPESFHKNILQNYIKMVEI
jgi:hypothetical protein